MKRKRVEDIFEDEKLLNYIFNYRNFINLYSFELIQDLHKLGINSITSSRVKALNSIQYKIENYQVNHENGKIPLKKCLNDIFGFRIILEEEIDFEYIKNYVNSNFSDLKCISSIKGEYKAVHIYFGNDDNTNFQWELQIWDRKNEVSNY